jgi:uncharacterized membrane protein SirB2
MKKWGYGPAWNRRYSRMVFAIAATALLLGGVWVYLIPYIRNLVPATWQTNTIAQIVITGGLILLAVFVVSLVVKQFGIRMVEAV